MFKEFMAKGRFLALVASVVFILTPLGGYALAAGETYVSGQGAENHEGLEGEERDQDHGESNSEALKDLRNRFINFILLVIILVLVIKKSGVSGYLSGRIEEIKKEMEELARQKEAREQEFKAILQQLREFEENKQEIIDQFVNEGQAEKEKIIAEAEERAKQIISQAEITVEHETQAAMNRLKREVMAQAAEKAREMIAAELTDEDQDRLVDDFIERVGEVH